MTARWSIAAGLIAAVLALAHSPVASAAEPDRAKGSGDKGSVEACLASAGHGNRALEACIGKVAGACIGPDEGARRDAEVVACLDGEQAQWDRLLNRAYQVLLKGLEQDQQVKLRDMQRAWIDSRNKTCKFYYDVFQGTMANPMIANCLNLETGRRAIFLRAFVDDLARQ
ncbi:lysozyme inhibitor LprI family protein [Bradyrhizobium sp. 2TAF24]|uniref:lysozyme inhibitor LprI family protein n=1 Tax=Bradyrhizobium sp. 2TAF24 TaxID=3233011 RepID=UPI003F91D4BF